MQNSKKTWKANRAKNPCKWCGRDHETRDCLTYNKRGSYRPGMKRGSQRSYE